MNDKMLKLFTEHEKTAGPPLGLDTDELARKGRKRLAARRVSAVGGLGAVIAVIAVAAVTLTSLASPAPADQAADSAEQPEYPLPDLPEPPDGQRYAWVSTGSVGETSKKAATAYGQAFRDWFDDNGTALADWTGMAVNTRFLYSGSGPDDWDRTSVGIPYYGIALDPDGIPPKGLDENPGRAAYGDDDSVSLRVHPRGSFEPGAGDTYEYLATCTDGVTLDVNDPWHDTDYTCDEAKGPDDELVLRQHAVLTDDHTRVEVNRVIVYRTDGTAVVVDDQTAPEAGSGPRLNFDELTDLALSMPDAPVED